MREYVRPCMMLNIGGSLALPTSSCGVAIVVLWLSLVQNGGQIPTVNAKVILDLPSQYHATVLAAASKTTCTCGCKMSVLECRSKDPSCTASRELMDLAIREAVAGKSAVAISVNLAKLPRETAARSLGAPVEISTAGDPVKGPAGARFTIVEFSDFQCPFCAEASASVRQVLDKFPKDVRVIFKQFPLGEIHSQAQLAAEASLAAQAQTKFWEMHDKLYANYRRISRPLILKWAREIGLDMKRFRSDLDGHRFAARVSAERREGERAGVEGTPTFFVNGRKLNSVFNADAVSSLISQPAPLVSLGRKSAP
jgi:protein-disulfide isomerase